MVDEGAADGDSTYISLADAASDGEVGWEWYGTDAAISAGATITQFTITVRCEYVSPAVYAAIYPYYRLLSGESGSNGGSAITSAYADYTGTFTTKADGTAFTAEDINNMDIGFYSVLAAGTLRVTKVSAVVTYTAAASGNAPRAAYLKMIGVN